MDFFERLYSGNMQPVKEAVDMVSGNEEYKRLFHELSKASEVFDGVLNNEQKTEFEKYREKNEKYDLYLQVQIFKLGFMYGAELKKATVLEKTEQPK